MRSSEWPMAILALPVIPVLVMDERATTPQMRDVAAAINWIIWIMFVAEYHAHHARGLIHRGHPDVDGYCRYWCAHGDAGSLNTDRYNAIPHAPIAPLSG